MSRIIPLLSIILFVMDFMETIRPHSKVCKRRNRNYGICAVSAPDKPQTINIQEYNPLVGSINSFGGVYLH